jgi:hypothetical protein
MKLKMEFEFTLPRGFLDDRGEVHREGCMRLATALDEIEALQDPRVQVNEAYLPVILLSRVIVRLGTVSTVSPQIIARLFASDLAYLEDLYQRLNCAEQVILGAVCPQCSSQFQLQVAPLGEV